MVHATRHACAATSSSDASIPVGERNFPISSGLGIIANICATAAAAATSTDISLDAKETSDDPVHSARAAAGLSALHDASVSVALRTALSIEGDVFQPLSSAIKSWLADHYIHTRVSVDQHTATAVMFDSFSTSKVLVVRNFPAAMKPTWQSVRDVIIEPIPDDHTRYMYNQSRSRVHALLADRLDKRDDLQQQREWWRQINLLPDTGKLDTLSSGTLWSAISRRGKSLLHIDDTDGVSWQWSGRKVWVFVNRDEAAAQGIQESLLDAMRDKTPGLYRFINWERCTSFQWTIVNEGDTLFLSGDLLHAVSCIGDEDAVASSVYCHIAGTPAALKAAAVSVVTAAPVPAEASDQQGPPTLQDFLHNIFRAISPSPSAVPAPTAAPAAAVAGQAAPVPVVAPAVEVVAPAVPISAVASPVPQDPPTLQCFLHGVLCSVCSTLSKM